MKSEKHKKKEKGYNILPNALAFVCHEWQEDAIKDVHRLTVTIIRRISWHSQILEFHIILAC